MTKIATIYNEIVTILEANLTDYIRLPNPYAVEENTYLHLRKGFGIGIGPGNDTQRYVGCLVSWQRIFSVILVNQITTTDNNTSSRVLIEQGLLDDHDALRKAFYLNSTLNGNAVKSTVLDDQGVAFIDADTQTFIGLEMSLYVEYVENPND